MIKSNEGNLEQYRPPARPDFEGSTEMDQSEASGTPHMQTFLHAGLQLNKNQRRIEVQVYSESGAKVSKTVALMEASLGPWSFMGYGKHLCWAISFTEQPIPWQLINTLVTYDRNIMLTAQLTQEQLNRGESILVISGREALKNFADWIRQHDSRLNPPT